MIKHIGCQKQRSFQLGLMCLTKFNLAFDEKCPNKTRRIENDTQNALFLPRKRLNLPETV